MQNVFTKLHAIDKSKLPSSNESTWLYSVTKNETLNFLQKKNNDISLETVYEIEDKNNEINEIIDQDSYNRLISKLEDEETKGNPTEEQKENVYLDDKEEQTQENIIIDAPESNNINYIGISFIGISSVFFIITIIFSIIFAKHQLKRRKNLSK